MMAAEDLKHKLIKLKEAHRALEEEMQCLMGKPLYDQLAVQRLKKQKLLLKDEILRIQKKLCPDIIAIGDVDEANACIGLVRLSADMEMDKLLSHIQNDLFDMGADLCVVEAQDSEDERLRIHPHQVSFLEEQIDFYNQYLPPLTSFVLPGGTAFAASLHQARTVVRRAERTICGLKDAEPVNEYVIQYINRLSDLLFVLARFSNHQAEGDVLWVPGANR